MAFRAASGDLLGNYTPRLPCLRFLQTPRVPMQVIPFYIHLLHTQPDLLEKSQGTAEIKFRECLKKRGQSFAGLWARDHDIIIIMIFGIFSSLDTDFDTHDLWDEMNEIKEALAREGVLLDSKLSHSGEPTASFTQLLSSSGPCTD